MPTAHNQAKLGDFGKTVLLPGDPLRAKFIAETFLEDVKQVNSVRNMFGYTGYYKGKKVSVMGSGMGMPSLGIYATELYNEYGVESIIRVGSAGSYQKECEVFDVIIAQGASTNSSWASQYDLKGTFSALGSFDLLEKAYHKAKDMNVRVHVGNILSSDIFYNDKPEVWKNWARMGILCVEMETYALYSIAAALHKKALTILTISDSFVDSKITTSEKREKSFKEMMEIALEIAE